MTTVFVPAGQALILTAISAGSYYLIGNPGDAPGAPVAILAAASAVIGPFNDSREYAYLSNNDDMSASLAVSGFITSDDDAAIALLAPKASPTFTGTVILPSTTSIGTVSNTEISYLDGVTSDIQTQIDTKQAIAVLTNVGAVSAGSVATERGNLAQHKTTLAVNSTLPAIAGGANLSVGKLLYTFPAGAIIVHSAYMSMGITQTEGFINADTPDVGLGTTIASGVNALLSDTAGAEDILTGQTANNCTGTAEVKTVADQILVIEAAGDHTVYFNVADGWAASGDAAALMVGTVVLNWSFVA